ncbi:MAG: cation-translocating P-type ATPase [Burkholderiales bacterium]|nr:cation-translocating P-type ATPase [Flavobacterium sp.]
MPPKKIKINGLTDAQVIAARKQYGPNKIAYKKTNRFLNALIQTVKDPMKILLLAASILYFISGKTSDGIFLASAIILIAVISPYQNARSHNALEKLKDFTKPKCKVTRNGVVIEISTEELVLGDSLMVEEGNAVAADGTTIYSNDFSVNEAILTGESMSVNKDKSTKDNTVFQGTTAIGAETKLGKIGRSLEEIKEEKTPLEIQIGNFVKKMAIAGAMIFLIVWIINYLNSHQLFDSLLKALTLAMSILPEEIPIGFTTFIALGAWHMMKNGIIVKQMKMVETLGSATVICIDKTGTITENKMSLAKRFTLKSEKITDSDSDLSDDEKQLIKSAMWASEPIPFDPMEVALHEMYSKVIEKDERPNFRMAHEYPLPGKPPMMTHIFENKSGDRIIAAKGASEAIIKIASLSVNGKNIIQAAIKDLSSEGYRILAVGKASFEEKNYSKRQQPRPFANTFFHWKELSTSIMQGLLITVGTVSVYQFSIYQGFDEQVTRTMVFLVIVTSNIFLTLMNRSFYYSIFTTFRYKNNLVFLITGITIVITALLLYVKPLTHFFLFEHLNINQLSLAIAVGAASVLWYELVKIWKCNRI